MDDVVSRMQEPLKEFRVAYTGNVVENIALYAIFNMRRDLKLEQNPTLEEFKKYFTKEMETKVIHECAFRAMRDLDGLSSSWSGGQSITNLLEQEKREIIIKTFSSFRLGEDLQNKLKEILTKGESK